MHIAPAPPTPIPTPPLSPIPELVTAGPSADNGGESDDEHVGDSKFLPFLQKLTTREWDYEIVPTEPNHFPVIYVSHNSAKLTLYRSGTMEAVCGDRTRHGAFCRFTRTRNAPSPTYLLRRPFQGRPMGLFACFWLLSECQDIQTADDHLNFYVDFRTRRRARRIFKIRALTCPSLMSLLRAERPVRDGEHEEPEGMA